MELLSELGQVYTFRPSLLLLLQRKDNTNMTCTQALRIPHRASGIFARHHHERVEGDQLQTEGQQQPFILWKTGNSPGQARQLGNLGGYAG